MRIFLNGLGQDTPVAEGPKTPESYLRISTHKAEIVGAAPVPNVTITVKGMDDQTFTAQIPDDEYHFKLPYPVGTCVVASVSAPGRKSVVIPAKTFADPSQGHMVDMHLEGSGSPVPAILIGIGLVALIGAPLVFKR